MRNNMKDKSFLYRLKFVLWPWSAFIFMGLLFGLVVYGVYEAIMYLVNI